VSLDRLKPQCLSGIAVFVWLLTNSALAAPTLVWDPNPEPDVAGYNVYFSDTTSGSNGMWNAGRRCDLPLNLAPGHTYRFTVSAYNQLGVESAPSAPIQYEASVPRLTLNVTWDPSAFSSVASYTLYYGELNQTAQGLPGGLGTSAAVYDLTRGVSYFLYVIGRDSASNSVDSWQQVIITMPAEGDPAPVHIPRVNQPPQVTLTSPAPLTTYAVATTVPLAATALDPDGAINSVEFYIGTTRVATRTNTPYTASWTGVNAGTYQVSATARDLGGAVTRSTTVQITLREPIPSAPANLTAVVSESAIQLHWTDTSTNELGFRLYRSTGSGYTQIALLGANSFQHLDTPLAAGTTYSYRLTAYNNSGESGAAQVSATTTQQIFLPPPPGSITARAATNGIQVSWSLSEGALRYQLQRSLSGTGTFAAITATQSSSFTDANVTPGTAYYYRVLAEANGYTSGPSPVASAVALAADSPPAAPTNLKASVASKTQINLTWRDNATNETSFVVERSSDGTQFTPMATLPSNSSAYADGSVAPRRRYYYRVRSQNAAGSNCSTVLATKTR
jgi:fibronectin type 3 domain-containing protein